MRFLALNLSILAFLFCAGQYPTNPVKPTTNENRIAAVEVRNQLLADSRLSGIEAQNLGPTIMSGRVVDLVVDPVNNTHFFVAYATGGVWETKNNGQSFVPIFDNNGYTIHCGALAVDWKKTIIYVGTGEANSSRSSYAGYGIFSGDFSDSLIYWKHIGLIHSQHISRIVLDPTDDQTIYVACMGNLFSANKERGIYKTVNGGNSWQKMLYVNENVSAVDLEMDPTNSQRMYAAMWQKSRRAWNFWEGGEQSGIYISEDAGVNWSRSASFPQGKDIGRIGLSISNDGVVFAILDNQSRFAKQKPERDILVKNDFKEMSKDDFLALPDSSLKKFLSDNGFPKHYSAKDIKKRVKRDELSGKDLFDYLTDSNAALFEDPVRGAELYVSRDNGKSWSKTHNDVLENVCYSYGYYFGVVTVNPSNSKHVIIAGVPLLSSDDGGANFTFIGGDNVHVDHHSIWINPSNSLHLINGNDGGINISYDGGENWTKCNSPSVGQFYTVAVDNQKHYNVYGGLQDNGVWKGPNSYESSTRWHQEGVYPYKRILGGDGMRIQIDSRDNTIYTGYQFGHYYRIPEKGKRLYIHPKQDLKEPHLRWNWQTPILLSSHNEDILYMGSNKLHRSMDKGENFEEISDDLTYGGKPGDVSYGTLTSISESPLKFGLIYTGADDGSVQMTKDGGDEWINISKGLPNDLWVRKVIASRYKKERVYVLSHGHTWDFFESHLYVSDDYGQSWNKLGSNLPNENLNIVIEDGKDEDILYVGTDGGLFVSFDQGVTFESLSKIPPVAIHDLTIQESNRDLIVATHGRGLYKVELEPLYKSLEFEDSTYVFQPLSDLKFRYYWGERSYDFTYRHPSKNLEVYLKEAGDVNFQITDTSNNILLEKKFIGVKGYNKFLIDLKFQEENEQLYEGQNGLFYPKKGALIVISTYKGEQKRQSLTVK